MWIIVEDASHYEFEFLNYAQSNDKVKQSKAQS